MPRALALARRLGWQFDIMSTSFFLSRRALRLAVRSGMPRWQDRLFIGLARSSDEARFRRIAWLRSARRSQCDLCGRHRTPTP